MEIELDTNPREWENFKETRQKVVDFTKINDAPWQLYRNIYEKIF